MSLGKPLNPKDREIINAWITKQYGFYMAPFAVCPVCKKELHQKVTTKRTGFCMPCFIEQVVNACKKAEGDK